MRANRSVILRLEVERGAVDAIAQPAPVVRTVGEHVAEVPLAARAGHLGADHAVRRVAELVDHAGLGPPGEARPARAAIVLVVALEQRLPAPGAGIFARGLVLLVLAGERALGAVLAEDLVLLG